MTTPALGTPQFYDNYNLPPLMWSTHPTARDAFIDRVKVTIPGKVRFLSENLLQEWFTTLTDNGLDQELRFFGAGHARSANRWQISTVSDDWTLGGELTVYPRGREGTFAFSLNLNPTRTLAHLLSHYPVGEFRMLSGRQFFQAQAGATTAPGSLDQKDNMILGRHIPHDIRKRERFFGSFLETYEIALQRFLQEILFPDSLGRVVTYGAPDICFSGPYFGEAHSPEASWAEEHRLKWGEITLNQCEVYWERKVLRAVPWMRTLADQALAAARDVRIRRYDTERELEVARDAGSLVVSIPLDAGRSYRKVEKELVIYAKADNRIRFEVRYYSDLPDVISNTSLPNTSRLGALLCAAREDAHLRRLPWDKLALVMQKTPPTPAAELIPLCEAVRRATDGHLEAFQAALEALLLTGGISETANGGWASETLLDRLAKQGVIESVKLVSMQRGTKRYRLATKYRKLLKTFRAPKKRGSN